MAGSDIVAKEISAFKRDKNRPNRLRKNIRNIFFIGYLIL